MYLIFLTNFDKRIQSAILFLSIILNKAAPAIQFLTRIYAKKQSIIKGLHSSKWRQSSFKTGYIYNCTYTFMLLVWVQASFSDLKVELAVSYTYWWFNIMDTVVYQ